MADAATNNTTGDTAVTDPVSVQFFEAPAPDPFSNEAFRVVVAQPMEKNVWPSALSVDRG